MGKLMGEHQLFSQREPIKSSFVVHSKISRKAASRKSADFSESTEAQMSVF